MFDCLHFRFVQEEDVMDEGNGVIEPTVYAKPNDVGQMKSPASPEEPFDVGRQVLL